jgi:hypothetical protein
VKGNHPVATIVGADVKVEVGFRNGLELRERQGIDGQQPDRRSTSDLANLPEGLED